LAVEKMLVTNSAFNIKNSYKTVTKPAFGHGEQDNSLMTKKQKMTIFGTSAAGMVAGLALCGRRQGLNIFKWDEFKKLKIESVEILALATGSIIGGLAGGISVDRSNKREKLRESLQQFVGNIIFPISFVMGANYLYDKVSDKLPVPKFNNKVLNAVVKSLPPVLVTLFGLCAGILTGNKVANSMNNKLFKEKEDRDIKISDFAAHVDDTLLGASLVAQNLTSSSAAAQAASAAQPSVIGAAASKLIPPALVIPGYVTGTAQ